MSVETKRSPVRPRLLNPCHPRNPRLTLNPPGNLPQTHETVLLRAGARQSVRELVLRGSLVDAVRELEPLRLKAAPRLFEDEVSHGGFEIPKDYRDRR